MQDERLWVWASDIGTRLEFDHCRGLQRLRRQASRRHGGDQKCGVGRRGFGPVRFPRCSRPRARLATGQRQQCSRSDDHRAGCMYSPPLVPATFRAAIGQPGIGTLGKVHNNTTGAKGDVGMQPPSLPQKPPATRSNSSSPRTHCMSDFSSTVSISLSCSSPVLKLIPAICVRKNGAGSYPSWS